MRSAFRFEERQPRDERERGDGGEPPAGNSNSNSSGRVAHHGNGGALAGSGGRDDPASTGSGGGGGGGNGSGHPQYGGAPTAVAGGGYSNDYHHHHHQHHQQQQYNNLGKPPRTPTCSGSRGHGGGGGGGGYSPANHHHHQQLQQYSQAQVHAQQQQYPPSPHSHTHSLTPRKLQSVVTSSFSLEDEQRDDLGRHHRRMLSNDHHHHHHQRFASVERRNDVAAEREDSAQTERDDNYYMMAEFEDAAHGKNIPPPAPRAAGTAAGNDNRHIQRSFSTGSAKYNKSSPTTGAAEPMKRSYYHHSRPSDVQTGTAPGGGGLHPDFIPPKRLKVNQQSPRGGEIVITPRSPTVGNTNNNNSNNNNYMNGSTGVGMTRPPPRGGDWINRAPTWESDEDHYQNSNSNRFASSRAQSFPPNQQQQQQQQLPLTPPTMWSSNNNKPQSPMTFRCDSGGGQQMQLQPKDYAHVSPASDSEPSPRNWSQQQQSPTSPAEWGCSPINSSSGGGRQHQGGNTNGSMYNQPYRFWESHSPANSSSGGNINSRQQPPPSLTHHHQHHHDGEVMMQRSGGVGGGGGIVQPLPAHSAWDNNDSNNNMNMNQQQRSPHGGVKFDNSNNSCHHEPMTYQIQTPQLPRRPTTMLYAGEPSSSARLTIMDDKMQLVMDAAAATEVDGIHNNNSNEPLLLLALPQDRVALSETLCVVRENIEVFTATQKDVDAPAPGRKHAVVVGQVGLRCIHCRHTTKCSDRVKRAVCYPSSIKRIYRTVIDMKLDHFSQCRFVPEALKNRLHQLKAVQTRSTGTTMQYFIRAAHMLGMVDGPSGVRLKEGPITEPDTNMSAPIAKKTSETIKASGTDRKSNGPTDTVTVINRSGSNGSNGSNVSMETQETTKRTDSMMSTESFDSNGTPGTVVSLSKYYQGLVPLSLPEDKTSLSPLRCFLREQVCAFSATEEDIAVRAPTTFSISVGQVGIGCIYCVKQPAKLRSNRAVCFPFSIGRIYQSVADIQRFHFTECKMLPVDVRKKFLELQSASSKGSKGLATRQYWVTSAKKIGLVDTTRGIRFGRDPSKPEESKAFSLDILAQAAFTVTTANRQLVVPQDRNSIAEFLYVVMEQLQPCRFTEADRNKRRLKDVGCIGVECKHCAGQVDGRKFFWSSVNAVESNFVSVHTHMLECRMVPQSLKDKLAELKKLRKEQTAALKTGSQKAFFSRVWNRLHEEEASSSKERRAAGGPTAATPIVSPTAAPRPNLTLPPVTTNMAPLPLADALPAPLPSQDSTATAEAATTTPSPPSPAMTTTTHQSTDTETTPEPLGLPRPSLLSSRPDSSKVDDDDDDEEDTPMVSV